MDRRHACKITLYWQEYLYTGVIMARIDINVPYNERMRLKDSVLAGMPPENLVYTWWCAHKWFYPMVTIRKCAVALLVHCPDTRPVLEMWQGNGNDVFPVTCRP